MSSKSEKYKPVGPLADLLAEYEAPENVQRGLARRAGTLIGSSIPVVVFEGIIHESMERNGGLPDWNKVTTQVGTMATDAYKRLKR